MHKQPVYQNAPAYVNGVSEAIFKVGVCLPAGPMVTDDDVRYIVESIKEAITQSPHLLLSAEKGMFSVTLFLL